MSWIWSGTDTWNRRESRSKQLKLEYRTTSVNWELVFNQQTETVFHFFSIFVKRSGSKSWLRNLMGTIGSDSLASYVLLACCISVYSANSTYRKKL